MLKLHSQLNLQQIQGKADLMSKNTELVLMEQQLHEKQKHLVTVEYEQRTEGVVWVGVLILAPDADPPTSPNASPHRCIFRHGDSRCIGSWRYVLKAKKTLHRDQEKAGGESDTCLCCCVFRACQTCVFCA